MTAIGRAIWGGELPLLAGSGRKLRVRGVADRPAAAGQNRKFSTSKWAPGSCRSVVTQCECLAGRFVILILGKATVSRMQRVTDPTNVGFGLWVVS
jgi:hypothetical protein